jgi:hypothetical protein
MDKVSLFHSQAQAAEGRREALRWLAGRLQWERRLGQLRPDHDQTPVQQAA